MKDTSKSSEELILLIDAYCNREISSESLAELQAILASSETARKLYLQHTNVLAGLNQLPNLLDEVTSLAPIATPASKPISIGWLGSTVAVVLIVGVTYLSTVGFNLKNDDEPFAATQTANLSQPDDGSKTRDQATAPYVAQVVNISPDVVWGKETDAKDFLYRIGINDRLNIESGLVQIDYYSGASLILRAPSEFIATGSNAGRLLRGELTGRVDEGDFKLVTPSAEVIDLGTEFGIIVDNSLNTDVCVFDGKVQISSDTSGRDGSQSLLLTEGMAARAETNGQISSIESFQANRFTRHVSMASSLKHNEISLLSVLMDSSENLNNLAVAISPDDGKPVRETAINPDQVPKPEGSSIFNQTEWHSLVDGTFVPSSDGQKIQVDSLGSLIDLPPSEGRSSGPIWARRRVSTPGFIFNEHFWGGGTRKSMLNRLDSCDWGLIGVHSNAGITFDLQAISKSLSVTPAAFRTLVGSLDNSDEWAPGKTHEKRFVADFRVFVDGQLRASRLRFGKSDGDMEMRIPLMPEDRMLTVVTTDCGSIWYDQVLLIDPVIEIN